MSPGSQTLYSSYHTFVSNGDSNELVIVNYVDLNKIPLCVCVCSPALFTKITLDRSIKEKRQPVCNEPCVWIMGHN